MYIKKLNLINFRNYEMLDIEFNKNINLITGKNGQGKTNIVEAIYMLAFSKSFRTARDGDMIRFGTENLFISGEYFRNEMDRKIDIVIGHRKKGFRINGIWAEKRGDILGNFYVVVFSPEDLRIIKDGPRVRRDFLDRELCQVLPTYYSKLSQYNKTLQIRNKYLKNFDIDENLLDVYDMQLSELAAYIYIKRRDYVKNLSEVSGDIHKNISDSAESLEIIYKTQIDVSDDDSEEDIKNRLEEKLKQSRNRDIMQKNTNYGIHKDDIELFINSMDLKLYGSQGQQRTASIALKLSEIEMIFRETGEYPVLILDDVFSELDETRQEKLVKMLSDVQMFITSAENIDRNVFKTDETTVFTIKNAEVLSKLNGGLK